MAASGVAAYGRGRVCSPGLALRLEGVLFLIVVCSLGSVHASPCPPYPAPNTNNEVTTSSPLFGPPPMPSTGPPPVSLGTYWDLGIQLTSTGSCTATSRWSPVPEVSLVFFCLGHLHLIRVSDFQSELCKKPNHEACTCKGRKSVSVGGVCALGVPWLELLANRFLLLLLLLLLLSRKLF